MVLCVTFSFVASADVFIRTTRSAATLNAAGGTTVYSASAEINGLPVTLTVRTYFDEQGRRIADALAKTTRSNHIVIPSPIGPTTIVITIDGNPRGGTPTTAGIPNIPDFTPGFSAFNHDTKTRMVSGASPFPPEEALRSAAGALARQGWHPATPKGGTAMFHTKGNSIALVSATPRGDGGSSLIVMVKNP